MKKVQHGNAASRWSGQVNVSLEPGRLRPLNSSEEDVINQSFRSLSRDSCLQLPGWPPPSEVRLCLKVLQYQTNPPQTGSVPVQVVPLTSQVTQTEPGQRVALTVLQCVKHVACNAKPERNEAHAGSVSPAERRRAPRPQAGEHPVRRRPERQGKEHKARARRCCGKSGYKYVRPPRKELLA